MKAIPLRKHSIAPPPGGRCALRGRNGGSALLGGGGRARADPRRGGGHGANSHGQPGGRLRDGGAGPAPEGGEARRAERGGGRRGGEAAARGWVGRGLPGLVAKRVKSQSGGPADLQARGDLPANATPGLRGRGVGVGGPSSFRFWFGLRVGAAAGMLAQTVPACQAALALAQLRGNGSTPPGPSFPSGFPGCRASNPDGFLSVVPPPARGDIHPIPPRCDGCCCPGCRGPGRSVQ